MKTVAERILDIVGVAGVTGEFAERYRAKAAGRLIEETVELARACGLGAGDILAHTADALANEARKAEGLYPSLLPRTCAEPQDTLGELADVELWRRYVAGLSGWLEVDVEQVLMGKLADLEKRVKRGQLTVRDGIFYKRG